MVLKFGPDNPPIVIDNGTGLLKVGYSGEMEPRAVVPMILGRPKHMKVIADRNSDECFVGDIAGGREVTNYLKHLLTERGYKLITTCEHEIARDVKENLCYVAMDYGKELQFSQGDKKMYEMTYRLPDGQLLNIGSERFRAPELMFDPKLAGYEMNGIHTATNETILACGMDVRKSFWSNIILTGGGTMFRGFPERLRKELHRLAPKGATVKVMASPERKYSVWIGGAVLASLSTFNEMWVTREEYNEFGLEIVHQKCV
uniref:Actin n=1 Tax=Schistosoma haematobium TaxID=6185 RepID=A0A095A048_SCHHA